MNCISGIPRWIPSTTPSDDVRQLSGEFDYYTWIPLAEATDLTKRLGNLGNCPVDVWKAGGTLDGPIYPCYKVEMIIQPHPISPRKGFVISLFLLLGLLGLLALLAAASRLQGIGGPYLLYLAWDEQGQVQIHRANLAGSLVRQLTWEKGDVQDYALSPDRRLIAYATSDGQSTSLRLIEAEGDGRRLLLTCESAVCSTPVWHPDGLRLIFERRATGEDGIPGIPHLWWLDISSGLTSPLLENPDQPSQGAAFSPDGQWLSYLGSPADGIIVYNFSNGSYSRIAIEMGTPAIWSPDGQQLLYRNSQVVVIHGAGDEDHQQHTHDYAQGVYLFLTKVDGATAPLSQADLVDDASPAWQPEGEWIAFGRKQPKTAMGRQLWLMRSDGSAAHPLTDNPAIHHGLPAWSSDGKALIFQRFSILEPDANPAIWLYELGDGTMREVVSRGYHPTWLP